MKNIDTDPFVIKEGKIKDTYLKNYQFNQETGNYFNFSQVKQAQRLGQFINFKKLKIISYLLMMILVLLYSRIIYLQIIKGNEFRLLAEGNRLRLEKQTALRGIFYDRFGEVLVNNQPTFSMYLATGSSEKSIADLQIIFNDLNKYLNLDNKKIEQLINNLKQGKSYPMLVKENLNYEEALLLKIKTQKISEFFINDETYRQYPAGPIISHLLGYLGKISEVELANNKNLSDYNFNDWLGKTGLEYIYEQELKGINGYRRVEIDSLGNEKKTISQKNSANGKNFILTVDLELQKKIYYELEKQLKKINRQKAAAIALNPQTGEILALVSLPSYNSNIFSKRVEEASYQEIINNKNQPLFNRVISGEYPSGSTIKPLIAAAALEEKIININSQINSVGGIWYGQWFFPDWKTAGHGLTNVVKALAESVNTFFYLITIEQYQQYQGLGINKLIDYLRKFNFGNQSNIDLPNEKSGFIPSPSWKEQTKGETWYPGDTFHLAIGQGDILVTPLQIANLTAFFASDGIIYQPHLIKTIISENEKIEIKPKKIVEGIIDNKNVEIVKEGMKTVTSWGSAKYLNNLSIETAGKTGTAQVANNQLPHAWFTVFAPFTNSQIVLTIIIENGGEGSTAAVPVAYEILNWYFKKINN